ncbi:MAG: flagellar type III secretion system pore protein FliP [bacterium]|jgi:flagellar biosynthetic protein FliP|nr:flagellar type III secretion system pore protein FliP [bacterium]MBK9775239.1 flagellar type III secretion system pore protein FliP [bacterium]
MPETGNRLSHLDSLLRPLAAAPQGAGPCRLVRVVHLALLLALLAGLAAPALAAAPIAPIRGANAAPPSSPTLTLKLEGADGPKSMDSALKIVILMTVLSLAPAILMLLTSFTRIVIVLGFLRQAIGANQAPANQILVGLAVFLTMVVMAPTFTRINTDAVQPLLNEQIGQREAFEKAQVPLKEFMLRQVREKDIALFLDLTQTPVPGSPEELPMLVVVPAFVIGELKTAFQMGFVLFMPFLIIDMVVASVLMSMGMMMLPPVLISLPFKILLFVLVDGWFLVVKSLVQAFQ